jgi:uncharacterized linocin/CFP29 family protein
MPGTQIDWLGKSGGSGEVAAQLQANGRMDPGLMRPILGKKGSYVSVYKGTGDPNDPVNYTNLPIQTNATLRRDEWINLDTTVLQISESRLNGVKDLMDKGLVYTLGNAMGTTVLEYEDISDALEAELTMDGITRAKNDRVDFQTVYLPIPIIHADYQINARQLASSRTRGNPLDTTMAERAARKVAERLESMLFTNTTYPYAGGTIYSYVNHPDRNQVTLSVNWDASAKSSRDILDEVLSLKQAAIDAFHYGPYQLYIPTSYETVMDEDYEDTGTTSTNKTIRQRILDIENINGVKVVDTLPADNVLLVQMTQDVVRLVKGMDIQNIHWQEEGRFVNKYKVITIQVPQIRSDQEGNSGVVHLA